VASVYEAVGIEAHVATVAPLNHNTAYFYKFNLLDPLRVVKVLLMTLLSFVQLVSVVRKVRPDIVHLNSSTLVLYIVFFRFFRLPVVYHVREYVVRGYFGFRRFLIRSLANALATAVIYISEQEQELLKTTAAKSYVVYNYVRLETFMKWGNEPLNAIQKTKFTVLTLGGIVKLKGGSQLLASLAHLKNDAELWVLGGNDPRVHPDEIAKVDGEKYLETILGLLARPEIATRVKFLGRTNQSASYIQACDALIFWANSPHFPRPVFEAWLLKKPVIYHNPGFNNPYITRQTVVMVNGTAPGALASAIETVGHSNVFDADRVNRSFNTAIEHFTEQNFQKIHSLYRLCVVTGK